MPDSVAEGGGDERVIDPNEGNGGLDIRCNGTIMSRRREVRLSW